MLVTFVFVGILILGLVGMWLVDHTRAFDHDVLGVISFIIIIIGFIGVFASTVVGISNHTCVPLEQAKLDLEYETLLNEVAYVKELQNGPVSDLTRIEYTNIAERVLEWNKKALEAQTLGNSLWMNWFYNDADRSMKFIEFK